MKKILLSLFVLFLFTNNLNAQSCPGSLGDPVVKETFGTGTANAALVAGLTNYNYANATCPQDGSYKLTNATSGCFGSWHTLTEDHTSGDTNGRFMLVNAANTAGEFYRQTVNGLCPNTIYQLSTFIVNVLLPTACTGNPNRFPNITLRIESPTGTLLQTFNSGNIPSLNNTTTTPITPAQWTQISTFFTATGTSVVLKLINNAPGGCGNDLALDDIEFRACGPTVSSLVASSTSANLCLNTPFALNSSISPGYTNPVFQWQESTDQVSWTNIGGATSLTYSASATSAGTRFYRMLASESGNINTVTCRVASNVLTINTFNYPNPPIASNIEYCQNAMAVPLTATSSTGGTLNWFTFASGGTRANSITPPTGALGTTTYYVSQTVNGCESQTRTPVNVLVSDNPKFTVTAPNSCINSGTATFTTNGNIGGNWTVSGGGTITNSGIFTPTATGCFTATYTVPSSNCFGTNSFLVYPAAPVISAPTNTCNGAFTLPSVAAASGFTVQYSIDGQPFSTSPSIPTAIGCHTIKARYVNTNACGGTPANTPSTGNCGESNTVGIVIFPPTPSLGVPSNTCAQAFTLPQPASYGDFDVQYSINGGAFSSTPAVPTTPGCHTFVARYALKNACGTNATGTVAPTACSVSNTVNVVIFPNAPTLGAIANSCNSALTLPSVPALSGFNVAYSIDSGPFIVTGTGPSTLGCHNIRATYLLAANCGSTLAGSQGSGNCNISNTQYAVVFPLAPSAPTVSIVSNAISVSPPPTVSGFEPQYSYDDGITWTTSSNGPTADNCTGYKVKTRYTAQGCGTAPSLTPSIIAACSASPATTQIKDTTPPTITCPAAITVSPTAGNCNTNVTGLAPTVSDNCRVRSVTWIKTGATTGSSISTGNNSTTANNTNFNQGLTVLTYTVTDAAGLTSTCSVNVTVNNLAPTISCPAAVVSSAGIDCKKIITGLAPITLDNCGVPTITYSITGATMASGTNDASGTEFSKGLSTVTYTATDAQGATATCSFTVTVNDVTPPEINCPPNQTIELTAACQSTMPDYTTQATATDNCEVTVTQTPAIGSVITGSAMGNNYTVTLTASDATGNTSTCSFQVTVIDSTPLAVNCLAVQNLELSVNCTAELPDYRSLIQPTNLCTPAANIVITQSPAPGTMVSGVGQLVVTFTAAITGSSKMSTCEVIINKIDITKPTISCPNNVVVNTASGICTATIPNIAAIATDGCGIASVSYIISGATTKNSPLTGINDVSGTIFNKGVSTVSYLAKDASGNEIGCSFTVTVNDIQVPTILCPANITVNTSNGSCEAVVNYVTPVGADNCSGAITSQTGGLASGSSFPKGTTTNTFLVTDASGNTATCSFTVTVNDTEPPQIVCPANISVNADAATCGAVVNFTTPVGTDNCTGSVTTQTTGLAAGVLYPIGTTTNTYLVTDASGNTATCSFTVTVVDNILPTITCPSNVTQNVDAGICTAVVTFTAPAGNDNCPGAVTTQTAGLPSGSAYPVGTTTNTFTVTDAAGNSSTCSFTVTVVDNILPNISCPANLTQNVDAGNCTALVTYTAPTVADNCPNTTITQIAGLASGAAFPVGTTTNIFQVTDASGNSATCSFTVTISDNIPPVVICPNNISQNVDAGSCSKVVNYTTPVGTDNCTGAITIQTAGLPTGSVFPIGTTTNSFLVTDAAGNSAICSFTVTIADNISPTIVCPANISQNVDAASCNAIVNYASPTINDNCPGATVTQTAGLPTGSTFPIGVTTNTFVVTDAAGNSSTCSFTVTIIDNISPTISCPANVSQNVDAGLCSAVVNYSNPVGDDNCPGFTVTRIAGLASGAAFPVGNTIITFRVTDAAGNSSNCSFTVTVVDNILPTIVCPSNITQNVDAGNCTALVNFTPPIGADNCPGAATSQIAGLPSGSAFPVGITTNTFRVTDTAGNAATCSFTVTVTDNILPTIICPTNISQNVDAEKCDAIVNYTAPIGTDNCPGASTVQIAGLASGAIYPVGVTTNVFRVTDAAGNSATCSFIVTISDNINPIISCPTSFATSAGSDCKKILNNVGPASVTDNCGIATITYAISGATIATGTNSANGTSFNKGLNTITYTATDVNGNVATCSFTVTINDVTPPEINCPPNQTIELTAACQSTMPDYTNQATTTDNCGITSITQSPAIGSVIAGSAMGNNYTVTLTASDAAGNNSTCSFQVNVIDSTPLAVNCLAVQNLELSVNCTAPLPDYRSLIQPTNLCTPAANIVITQSPAPGTIVSGVGFETITFTATITGSSKMSTCEVIINKIDITKPTITCPTDVVVNTSAGICTATIPNIAALANDGCGIASVSYIISGATTKNSPLTGINDASGTVFNIGASTVSYLATDASGNTSGCSFTVTVNDIEIPKIVCPANITKGNDIGICGATITYTAPIGTDNCLVASTLQTAGLASGSVFPIGTTTNTFEVTDASGNTATCSFTVTINDTQLPTISCPAPIAVNNNLGKCGAIVTFATPMGADNCPGVTTVQTTGLASGSEFPKGITTNTFLVTDASGNTANCSFTITVTDAEKPIITTCLAPVTFECPANIPFPIRNVAEFEAAGGVVNDNCTPNSLLLFSYADSSPNGDENCEFSFTRTYTFTDESGNSSTCGQLFTIDRTKTPIVPTNGFLEVQCITEAITPVPPVVFDFCGVAIVPTLISTVESPSPANCGGTRTYTYSYKDCANLESIWKFEYLIKDVTKPTASSPADINVECYDDIPTADPTVVTDEADNCDAAPVVTLLTDIPAAPTCNGGPVTVTRLYQITDCSGNSITVTQTIIVKDATKPTASNPAAINVECYNDIPGANPAVVTDEADNCDVAPVVTFVSDTEISSINNNTEKVIERKYSVKDCSGNEIFVVQNIKVKDTTPPTASNPASIQISCFQAVPAPNVTLVVGETDNCSTPTVSFKNDNITSADCNITTPITILRTFEVTDAAGNKTTVTQEIIVNPVAKPIATDDVSSLTNPGVVANISILANDKKGVDGAAPTAAEVSISLIAPAGITPNINGSITIPNQGTYNLNSITGVVSFTPIPGFTGDPTPIKYTITELLTGLVSNEASVSPDYAATPPTAVADVNAIPTASGANTSIDILANDTLADGTKPSPADVSITLIAPMGATLSMDGLSVTIPNQGTYTLNPATGIVTFDPIPGFTGDPNPITYTITDKDNGQTSAPASVSPDYAATPPTAVADANAIPTASGANTSIDILANDTLADGTKPAPSDVTITLIAPMGATLSMDGLSVTIPNQGTYTLDPATGIVTFDPIANYLGDPTPISYTLTDKDNGTTSAPATITLDYTNLPLPVNLVSFIAITKNESVDLIWTTSDMKNFSHFEVQKSGNSLKFKKIGQVNGSNVERYLFEDNQPNNGVNYYRLKMVDIDGTFKYSNIVSANFINKNKFIFVENPINNGSFRLSTNYISPSFILMNTIGQGIGFEVIVEGNNEYLIKPFTRIAGVYYLKIVSEGEILIKKLIIY